MSTEVILKIIIIVYLFFSMLYYKNKKDAYNLFFYGFSFVGICILLI